MRRGLVIGCGGTLGAAWTLGTLIAVEQSLGWDVRDADVLVGTSAGAEFTTFLACGLGTADLLEAWVGKPGAHPALAAHLASAPPPLPPLPSPRLTAPGLLGRRDLPPLVRLAGLAPAGRGDLGRFAALAARLCPSGWLPHPAAWLVAVDAGSGERVAFGSPGAPEASVGEALRASWAIPGWMPPVPIGGRVYVDGGAHSPRRPTWCPMWTRWSWSRRWRPAPTRCASTWPAGSTARWTPCAPAASACSA
ncbi:patatin-like phospholipase family protein [Actinokineospora soli]|uniref:Patatin-like phospholipase family protein n=1 Tax=Actinokineospora soli TaxID=1048753 RepID=A0ABW2TII8_9PSEU